MEKLVLFRGPLVSHYWTHGDACPVFQSQRTSNLHASLVVGGGFVRFTSDLCLPTWQLSPFTHLLFQSLLRVGYRAIGVRLIFNEIIHWSVKRYSTIIIIIIISAG